MKKLLTYIIGTFVFLSLSSCANGKKLQEEAPVELQPVYYEVHLAYDDSNSARYNLFVPTGEFDRENIQLDSVYFRGKKAELNSVDNQPDLYVAHFDFPGEHREVVMHVDPKEEYGNQVPVLEKIPFDLEADEAVLVFTKNAEQGYYKITGIFKRNQRGEIK